MYAIRSYYDFDLATCQVCHSTEAESLGPGLIQHSLEEREQCDDCHELELQPESHQTADFSNRECFLCHQVK